MTIAARTRHLASHLPPVLHVGKQSTLILIGESPLRKRNKFHHMLRSSMAVHKLRAELPATERKLRPFHTRSTRLCSEPLLLRCSVEGNPANRRPEKKSHAHCVHTSSCCNCPAAVVHANSICISTRTHTHTPSFGRDCRHSDVQQKRWAASSKLDSSEQASATRGCCT